MSNRILIVEDEAVTAMDMKQELITLGYEVVGIEDNADDADRATGELRPDLVLMDIRLYGSVDGIEAATNLRGKYHVPIVFLTAHSDTATLQRAIEASPFGYLLKPFQIRELKVTIEVAIFKHRKEEQVRHLVNDLTAALEKVRLLSGLLPICAWCKKIRDEKGKWHVVEEYVQTHSEAKFTHGACPDCCGRLYAQIDTILTSATDPAAEK